MNTSRACLGLILTVAGLFGQAKKPEFEVASIRPVKDQVAGTAQVGIRIDGAQVTMAAFSLTDAMRGAYNLKGYQIVGPDWLNAERFDFQAKIPAGAPSSDVSPMIASLIEDRFQIKSHRDKKEFSVYTLSVIKGATLKPVEMDPANEKDAPVNVSAGGSGNGVNINWGRGRSFAFANNKLTATKTEMAALADTLERFLDRPLVDQTDLKGNYDISIELAQEDYTAMLIRAGLNAGVQLPPQALRLLDLGSLDSLFRGLEKVGLKIEAKKAPLEVLVIDSIRRTPTDN